MGSQSTETISIVIDILLNKKDLVSSLGKQFNSLKLSVDASKASLSSLSSVANSTDKSLNKTSKSAEKTTKSINKLAQTSTVVRSLSRSFQDLGSAIRFSALTKTIQGLSDTVLSTSVNWIRYNNTLKFVYGSTEKANEMLTFLRDTSNSLGVSFEKSIDGFSQLAAAAKGGRLEGEGVINTYQALVETSSALGLSQYKLQSIFYAVTQMISKGTVQTEELKRQLGDQLPGALEKAAESMHMTKRAFVDLVKSGELKTEDFLPKFMAFLHSEFAETAKKNSKTIIGQLERLKNAWYDFRVALGKGEFLDIISDQVLKLTEVLKNPEIIDSVKGILNGILSLAGSISKIVLEFPKATVIITSFGLAIGALIGIMSPVVQMLSLYKISVAAAATETAAAGASVGIFGSAITSLAPILAGVATAIAGFVAAFGAIYVIVEAIKLTKEYIEVSDEAERISIDFAKQSLKYKQYASVRIQSLQEMTAATHEQNQAYAESLEGSLKYWEKIASSEAATGKVSEWTQEKINNLQKAMGLLHTVDPSVIFENMAESQKKAVEETEKVTEATHLLADGIKAANKDLENSEKEADKTLKSIQANLELNLAKGEITEEKYRVARLTAEKAHWEEIIKIRQQAVFNESLFGKGTAEYNEAVLKLTQAEIELTKTENSLADSIDRTNKATDAAIHSMELRYDAMNTQLEISLAKGELTEEKYNRKRLSNDKKHWADVLRVRQKAFEEIAKTYGKDTDEYNSALLKVKQAELELAKVTKDSSKAFKGLGKAGAEGARESETAWDSLADKVGMTVDELKSAVGEINTEITNAHSNLKSLSRDEEGNRISRTEFRSYSKMNEQQLTSVINSLMYRLESGFGSSGTISALESIADNMAKLKGLTEEQAKLYKQQLLKQAQERRSSTVNKYADYLKMMGGYSEGGSVPGVGDSDTVPARLTPGEFVIRKSVVSKLGSKFFELLNGGINVSSLIKPVQHFATGGEVQPSPIITLDFKVNDKNHRGVFSKDVAESLVQQLQEVSMVTV